jgi:hypothetical protein
MSYIMSRTKEVAIGCLKSYADNLYQLMQENPDDIGQNDERMADYGKVQPAIKEITKVHNDKTEVLSKPTKHIAIRALGFHFKAIDSRIENETNESNKAYFQNLKGNIGQAISEISKMRDMSDSDLDESISKSIQNSSLSWSKDSFDELLENNCEALKLLFHHNPNKAIGLYAQKYGYTPSMSEFKEAFALGEPINGKSSISDVSVNSKTQNSSLSKSQYSDFDELLENNIQGLKLLFSTNPKEVIRLFDKKYNYKPSIEQFKETFHLDEPVTEYSRMNSEKSDGVWDASIENTSVSKNNRNQITIRGNSHHNIFPIIRM